MEARPLHRFAVIADAHFHDPEADFGFGGFPEAGRRLNLRLPGDVARAPRIYNEAGAILALSLERLAEEGIRDVVLLGDYSDDGQKVTLDALSRLLARFRGERGMRFFALPGNHDLFGAKGRHRRKRYAGSEGEIVLVTSDPDYDDPRADRRIVTPGMYCGGYPDNLPAGCGFFRDVPCQYWESPFGTDPDPAERTYGLFDASGQEIRRLMDASYLVEPGPGLWFAMIDANVFAPDPEGEDGLADSTAAGWNALLLHKPFLVSWLADVAARAAREGKQLIHFSHYPVLETLDGTLPLERMMMGENAFHRRMPGPGVAEAMLSAGMRLHFSGHVHVNNTARHEGAEGALVNLAVPALVAFPAAVKIVTVTGSEARIDTLSLDDLPLDPVIRAANRRLGEMTGAVTGAMPEAETLGALLDAHLAHVTARRFLKREWPAELAALFKGLSLADLAQQAGFRQGLPEALQDLSALAFLTDWYRLRAGGALVKRFIAPARLEAYGEITGRALEQPADPRLSALFETMKHHLAGLPSDRLTVCLETGAIRS